MSLRTTIRTLIIVATGAALLVGISALAQGNGDANFDIDREYQNDNFGFSLSYPADMQVTTTDEPGGAQSITFMDESTNKQFEIIAIPYSQVDVSADDYAPHDAYGTNDQGLWLTDVNVVPSGGVLQVWFVRLGVMYEVLGMEGQEDWLIDILKTWQFD